MACYGAIVVILYR